MFGCAHSKKLMFSENSDTKKFYKEELPRKDIK